MSLPLELRKGLFIGVPPGVRLASNLSADARLSRQHAWVQTMTTILLPSIVNILGRRK